MIVSDGFSEDERTIAAACRTALEERLNTIRGNTFGHSDEAVFYIKIQKAEIDNPNDKTVIVHMGPAQYLERDPTAWNNRIGGFILGELMAASQILGGPQPKYDVKKFEMPFPSLVHLGMVLKKLGHEIDLAPLGEKGAEVAGRT